MFNPSHWPETLYGMPAADQILINRHYIVRYSYYYRQVNWALQVVERGLERIRVQRGYVWI